MKIIIYCFTVFFCSTAFAKTGCKHTGNRFNCVKYLKNYDGDTITFNIPDIHPLLGKKISIRVNGVDTPELKTKDKCEKSKARSAKKLVKSIMRSAKRIDLLNVKRGKYFRIVADVIVDGKDISEVLIKNKLAYRYDGGKKSVVNWCK